MKTNRLLAAAILAVLFTACGKDRFDGRLRISVESMNVARNSKVWVDPSSVTSASTSASWITGETINLNGTPYSITKDESDHFVLNTGDAALADNLYAIYPATTNSDGNDITVTNNQGSASTVVINSLAINYRGEGHDIILPMATGRTDKSGGKLLFKHLTGGLMLTLTDTSTANDYTVGSLKVVVYGDNETAPTALATQNVTTRWKVQGPTLPGGEIGSVSGDRAVGYASEMHFTLKTGGNPGKAIPHGDRTTPASINMVIPVTVTPIKKIVISCFDTDGRQLFVRAKELTPAAPIQVNYMYTIPEISF